MTSKNAIVPVTDEDDTESNLPSDTTISMTVSPSHTPRQNIDHESAILQISNNVELLRARMKLAVQLFKNIHVEQRAASLHKLDTFQHEGSSLDSLKRSDSMSSIVSENMSKGESDADSNDNDSESSIIVNSAPLIERKETQAPAKPDTNVESDDNPIISWKIILTFVHETLVPGSRVGNTWLLFILLLTMYNILLIPFRLAFVPYTIAATITFAIIDFFVDVCLLLDMILQFFIPFQSREGLEKDAKLTARHYVLSWFAIDLLSLLPIDLALIIPFPALVPFFRINKLIRMLRYFKYWRTVEDYSNFSTSAIRIPQFVILCFVATHWFACVFYLLLKNEGVILSYAYLGVDVQGKNVILQYIFCLYVVLSSMVGYGGSVPITLQQFVFAEVISLFGVLVIILLFGVVGSLISSSGENEAKQKKKLDEVKEYLQYRKVPKQTRDKIVNYYEFMARSRKGWDEQKILNELPGFLRVEVAMDINRKLIEKVPLFNVAGVTKMFIASVVVRLIPRVCLPQTIIVEQGELGREMFFISSGFVEVVSNDGKVIYKTLYEGSFFGEIALIYDTRRNATVRAGTFCDLYILTKDAFDEIALDYPEQVDAIKREAEKRMAEQKK